MIARFGVMRLIVVGMVSIAAGYILFLPVGINSGYAAAVLPTIVLAGVGFALAYGPLNIVATNGIAPAEQGLAGGLLNTSFQFGGALVLAIVTAVNNANVGLGGTKQALLDGFHPAIVVSVIAAGLGVLAIASGLLARPVAPVELVAVDGEPELVEEAA